MMIKRKGYNNLSGMWKKIVPALAKAKEEQIVAQRANRRNKSELGSSKNKNQNRKSKEKMKRSDTSTKESKVAMQWAIMMKDAHQGRLK